MCNLYAPQLWEFFSFSHPPLLFDPTFTHTQTQSEIADAAKERRSPNHGGLIEL